MRVSRRIADEEDGPRGNDKLDRWFFILNIWFFTIGAWLVLTRAIAKYDLENPPSGGYRENRRVNQDFTPILSSCPIMDLLNNSGKWVK